MTEQRPRAQSRGSATTLPQGNGLVFTTRDRPVASRGGWSNGPMRYGVSTVRAGRRRTLGLVFHDAAWPGATRLTSSVGRYARGVFARPGNKPRRPSCQSPSGPTGPVRLWRTPVADAFSTASTRRCRVSAYAKSGTSCVPSARSRASCA